MPTTIKHKIGSGAPLASDLVEGELGIDTVNGRVYTENSVGSIVELGANPAGEIQANAGIALPDSQKATFGASDDLQIYHNGTDSYIDDVGTGNLNIRGENIILRKTNGEAMVACNVDSSVDIYYDNSKKLATTSTGIDVTGTVTADGLTVTTGSASGTLATLKGSTGFGFTLSSSGVSPYVQELGVGGGEEIALTSGGVTLARFQDGGDISFYEDTGTTAKFFWDASAESLGIGTSSPSRPVHLSGAGSRNYFKAETTAATSGDEAGLDIKTATANWLVHSKGNAKDLIFYDAASTAERMRIDSSGNVGIGTSSPSAALDVVGEATVGNGTYGIKLSYSAGSTAGVIDTADSATQLSVRTGGTERMRIDSSGNLLVNTTTGVATGTLSQGAIEVVSKANENCINTQVLTNNLGAFNSSGATTAGGNIYYHGLMVNSSGTVVGSIAVAHSGTSYNTSSDYRLKENVVPLDNASSRVLALKPCRFNFIADPDRTVDGFLAHEAQEVVPEAVHGTKDEVDDEGNPVYQGIDQSKLVPLLTKALQEALTRIETLEGRIAALEA